MSTAEHRSDVAPASPRSRSPAEIEAEIRTIRARMDRTLDELEFRLSPGQMSAGAIDLVRDVVRGNPTRLARALRDNPIPVAMIAIGALWLSWAVSRTPAIEGRRLPEAGYALSDQRIRILLTGLAGATGQGADHVRNAEATMADPLFADRLRPLSEQLDRSAAALEQEVVNHGGRIDHEGPVHPAWSELHHALERGTPPRDELLHHIDKGLEGTLALFRDALHEDLPAELRVLLGAHFHDLETMRHRVDALRAAVA